MTTSIPPLTQTAQIVMKEDFYMSSSLSLGFLQNHVAFPKFPVNKL